MQTFAPQPYTANRDTTNHSARSGEKNRRKYLPKAGHYKDLTQAQCSQAHGTPVSVPTQILGNIIINRNTENKLQKKEQEVRFGT